MTNENLEIFYLLTKRKSTKGGKVGSSGYNGKNTVVQREVLGKSVMPYTFRNVAAKIKDVIWHFD